VGYVYKRGNRLWIGFWDNTGKLHQRATGFDLNQEAEANAELARVEERVRLGDQPDEMLVGTVTVRRYANHWNNGRIAQGLSSAADEAARLELHALPVLGEIELAAVRPRHVRDLVKALRLQGKLAPRTIRHVYGALHTMFHDAVVDELIPGNPCVLKRGELPKRVDKDPMWRATAVFTRGEVEQLISDDRIPVDRRVIYGLLALSGARFGEVAALRWRHYDPTLEPLGRLVIAGSWSTTKGLEKATKTEQPRLVPVHPTLATVLAQWKLGGWQTMIGRAPGVDDLIIPSRRGHHRNRHHSLDAFKEDLNVLSIRRRRQHDLRRTFISLARADGARRDVLERVTHGTRGDIIDMYTEVPWPLVCEEVMKLRVQLAEAKVLSWPGSRVRWARRQGG
jgi:integrase